MKVKVDMFPVFIQQAQGEKETDCLADDRREGSAKGTKPGRSYQEDVQDYVDNRGKRDENKGML